MYCAVPPLSAGRRPQELSLKGFGRTALYDILFFQPQDGAACAPCFLLYSLRLLLQLLSLPLAMPMITMHAAAAAAEATLNVLVVGLSVL